MNQRGKVTVNTLPASGRLLGSTAPWRDSAIHFTIAAAHRSAIIASRGTPLCPATARRIALNVPSRSGWWSGIAIRC